MAGRLAWREAHGCGKAGMGPPEGVTAFKL